MCRHQSTMYETLLLSSTRKSNYLDMIDYGWDSSMYRIMRDIMQNDVNCRVDLIPIDIYKLNLVENITDMRMSMDGRNMYVTDISLPCFRRISIKF